MNPLTRMTRALLATSLVCGLATFSTAQTTGVVGYNDFTIAGNFSGSTSCPFQLLPPALTPFSVDTGTPGAGVVLLINFNCPCTPCTLPFPATPTACPIPYSACTATTNQSLDLNPGFASCVFIAVAMPPANAAGISTLSIPLPSLVRFGAQAAVLHPCVSSSTFPVLFTQAYQISTT